MGNLTLLFYKMKTNKLVASLFMGLAVVACSPKSAEPATGADGEFAAPKEMTAKDYQPSKATVDSVSYLLGINFGSFLKGYNFGEDLNYSQIVKGMKDFINAKGNMNEPDFTKQFKVNPEKMNDMFNEYLENRHNYTMLTNKEKEAKYLAANAKKAGVTVTDSGLQYSIELAGNEVKPGPKDTVWVKYCGKLTDGTVFDQTAEDAEPVRFTLDRVVRGWAEGLQLIGEGGKIQLVIPSELGYGERGTQGIDPNSTLLFDVELVKVGKINLQAEN